MNYPDDCIQCLGEKWWETSHVIRPGALLLSIVPYFETQPARLVPCARPIPTSHGEATIALEKFTIDTPPARQQLPVAALTMQENETLLTFVGKPRPVVVLAKNDPLAQGLGNQKVPTYLVAPYYGIAKQENGRYGFPDAFIGEVKRGECPIPLGPFADRQCGLRQFVAI